MIQESVKLTCKSPTVIYSPFRVSSIYLVVFCISETRLLHLKINFSLMLYTSHMR
jgi:hypothetical protein